jgi:hypothetical protein
MRRRNANFRTEPMDWAWRPEAGERRARAGMRQPQIFPVGQRRLAPFLRISAHQIGAIWKKALMRVLIVGAPESLVCRLRRCSASEESNLSSTKRRSPVKTAATLSGCGRWERTPAWT